MAVCSAEVVGKSENGCHDRTSASSAAEDLVAVMPNFVLSFEPFYLHAHGHMDKEQYTNSKVTDELLTFQYPLR